MQPIRDAHGNTIGFLSEDANQTRALDRHGNPIATYNMNTGNTVDQHGQLVGRGNQLMRFFPL